MGNLRIEFAQALDNPLVFRGARGDSEGITSGDTREILRMLNGDGTDRGRTCSVFEWQHYTFGLELLHSVLRNATIVIDFGDYIHRTKQGFDNFRREIFGLFACRLVLCNARLRSLDPVGEEGLQLRAGVISVKINMKVPQ